MGGFYIQGPSKGKVAMLETKFAGVVVPQPSNLSKIPVGKALICVVDNGPFEAAGYCFNQHEFEIFTIPQDTRPKTWVIIDEATAKKETGYGDG